jgi:prepilin-type N-terminal cleavage/methylation domain-containing protein
MQVLRNKRKLKGVSLVEVLVVLAIVAATMVSAMRLSVTSLAQVKNNEIIDYATGIMLKALEVAKSPNTIKITSEGNLADYDGSYSLQTSGNDVALYRRNDYVEQINSCDRDSAYYMSVDLGGAATPPIVCMQLNVQEKTGLSGQYYELEARMVYIIDNETTTKSVIGYRISDFTTE